MNSHLSEFHSINRALARTHEDGMSDQDDIKQELDIKLLEAMPKLSKVPKAELKLVVFTAMRNQVRDIQRKSITRAPFNQKLETETKNTDKVTDFSWEDAADAAFMAMKDYAPNREESPDDHCSYSMLVGHVMDWAEYKGGATEKLLREFLEPSEYTLARWKEMCEAFPTYSKYEFIPPVSLGKMLGLTKIAVRRIMEGLRVHLITVGYEGDYFDNCFKPRTRKGKK